MARHRISVSRDDLPAAMKVDLDALAAGKRRRTPAPTKALRSITTALRGLVEAARAAGLPDGLSPETADAYEAALRARGAKESAIATSLGDLRRYARYTGQGLSWAEGSCKKDFRTLSAVFAAPHWRPYRAEAEALAADGVRPADIKIADAWLAMRPTGRIATEADIDRIVRGSLKRVSVLYAVMYALDPGDPDLRAIEAVRLRLSRGTRQKPGPSRRGRAPRADRPEPVSIPVDEIPADIAAVLARLRGPKQRLGRWPKPATVNNMEEVVRQVLHSARSRGLAEVIDMAAVKAWINDLDERDIRHRARKSYLNHLAQYADHAGLGPVFVEAILSERDYYHVAARGEHKRKVERLGNHPAEHADIADGAWRLLAVAPAKTRQDARRNTYLGAALLALLTLLPLRLKDLLGLVVGKDLIRDELGWRCAFESSKTGYFHDPDLHDAVTLYLDAAITLGADVAPESPDFWALYRARCGRPLLCHADGKNMGRTWVYNVCVEAFEHGSHFARTLLHDACVDHGLPGRELALHLCGQRVPETAVDYEVAANRHRARRADDALARAVGDLRAGQGA